MLSFFTGLLKEHWLTAVVFSATLGLAAIFSIQGLEIAFWKKEASVAKTKNEVLEMALKQQNAAIQLLHDEALAKTQKAEKMLQVANRRAAIYANQAQEIKRQHVSNNECDALRTLLDEYVKRTLN